ncbi:MAG: transposase [Cycloclasticus sp.]|nr:transposase [Cycloclasticus sp.]
MARKTKYDYYDDDFKVTAIELGSLPKVKSKDVADILDIHPVMLYRWKKELRDGIILKAPGKGQISNQTSDELKRLKQVEKSFIRLQQEHELLKKSIQFCSSLKKQSSSS